jgi:hypothetical protein
MPYLDTCDRCLTADSPAVSPISLVPSGPGGLLATYRCPACGGAWTCGWAEQPEEEVA